jgi:hypothetical protein
MARRHLRTDSVDPCRLVRRVSEILQLQPGNLIHLPDKPAGVFYHLFRMVLAGQSFGPAGQAGRGRRPTLTCRCVDNDVLRSAPQALPEGLPNSQETCGQALGGVRTPAPNNNPRRT